MRKKRLRRITLTVKIVYLERNMEEKAKLDEFEWNSNTKSDKATSIEERKH